MIALASRLATANFRTMAAFRKEVIEGHVMQFERRRARKSPCVVLHNVQVDESEPATTDY
jgi:hypothetical protein